MKLTNESELDEFLSRPYAEDIMAMGALGGDLMLLGAAGKMGISLAVRARRAADAAGAKMRVIAVSRFGAADSRKLLEDAGVETIPADLLDDQQLRELPGAANIVYLAARKFGSTGDEAYTWAMNTYLPARVAERFKQSRIALFSSGNVYPLVPVAGGGATEETPLVPVGEYAMTAVGRERMLTYCSSLNGTRVAILRLNYAVELRYGVLRDIGEKVFGRRPVDLTMGNANVIWQGDANSAMLRSFALASSPPLVLNLTGPETISVRWVAERFGELFGVKPEFEGAEGATALLNNAAKSFQVFGYPRVSVNQIVEWLAAWIGAGGRSLNKPTHFEARDGKF